MQRFLPTIAVLILLAAIVFGSQHYTAAERGDDLRLWILDIGQGDSILIDTPDHHQILVDGGPDSKVLQRLSQALPLADKEIDLIISTHNDADHLSGLNDVIQHYTVGKIWLTGAIHTTQTYQKFINLIAEKHIPTEKILAGSTISFGLLQGIAISPFQSYDGVTPDQQNAAGIVTMWQYGNETFLLTADVEQAQEQEMVTRHVLRPVDILKVGHHGSKTSSTEAFLQATTPKIAVISVGRNNKYGHPTQLVLDRLRSFNTPVLRTDQNGTIRFSIWPDHYTYKTGL